METDHLNLTYSGKILDPLEASLTGFSVVFLGRERKLAKIYETKDRKISYNVSIIADTSNRIQRIDIYRIAWQDGAGAEVSEEREVPDEIRVALGGDLLRITHRQVIR